MGPQNTRQAGVSASLTNPVHWTEMLVSAVTALLAILMVYALSAWILEAQAALLMVASMGASAVLLFAVPHGSLSQPWPLFGGHLVSALAGVTMALWVPSTVLAAALAVGLAVGLMHLLRCIHPPGGATALSAALGGSTVYGLGYGFVIAPVMLNVLILFLVAVVANYPFRWRRYPVSLMDRRYRSCSVLTEVSEQDLLHAMADLNVIVDITPEELREIADRALAHAREHGDTQEVVLSLGPRFVNVRRDGGWVMHKALHPSHEGHEAAHTLRLKLTRPAVPSRH